MSHCFFEFQSVRKKLVLRSKTEENEWENKLASAFDKIKKKFKNDRIKQGFFVIEYDNHFITQNDYQLFKKAFDNNKTPEFKILVK